MPTGGESQYTRHSFGGWTQERILQAIPRLLFVAFINLRSNLGLIASTGQWKSSSHA
jgi:hypothetical protein